jgi:hypothetical protein
MSDDKKSEYVCLCGQKKCIHTLDAHNSHIKIYKYRILHLKSQMFKMSNTSTKLQIHFSNTSVPRSHILFSSGT